LRSSLASHQLKSALIIVALFALSTGIRLSYMSRPLGEGHEYLTAHTLRIQQIWYEGGALNHKFLPIMTYDNPNDKNIKNQGRIKDQEGNYYYVSYGPLAHMVPYLIFKALHVYPDVTALQIFGLAVHFSCCLLVYLIVSALTRKNCRGRSNIPALMGLAVYLFSPVALWNHSNVYFSEMFVQVFFIAGVYVFLRLMTASHKGIYYALLGLSVFLMIFTEWLGAFFSLTLLIYCLFNFRKRSMRIVFGVVSVSSLVALALLLWHYSQIAGVQSLMRTLSEKYLERSGVFQKIHPGQNIWDLTAWQAITNYYILGYGGFFINLIYIYFIKKCFVEESRNGRLERILLFLCLWPVLMHHLVLWDFTTLHDFSVLKTGFLIALLTGLIYSKIDGYFFQKWGSGLSQVLRTGGLILCFCFMTVLSVGGYLEANKDIVAGNFEAVGKEIARVADKGEVIFLKPERPGALILPQIVFYAHRNIALWKSKLDALKFLKRTGAKRGVLMAFNNRGQLVREQHIKVDDGGG